MGIEVIRADAFLPDDEKVSSSVIRNNLRAGNIEAANHLLGYPYTIESRIVSGYQNGRKMGFPTANLDVNGCQQLLPASGCLCGHGALEGFCWMEARDDEHWASAYFQWHNHLDRGQSL